MIQIATLKNFDRATYKAAVQLTGSLTTYFDNVSVARNIPEGSMALGNYVILAIPGGNPKDACVVATWPGGTPPATGDMLKSVYDTNDDGTVDNSQKLQGSTKAEVQDHPPKAHKTSHQQGGTDQINLEGLSGLLTTPQTPAGHKTSHQLGGSDQINVTGLSGELADNQKSTFLKLSDTPSSYAGQGGKAVTVKTDASGLEFTTPAGGGGFTYTAINPPAETSPTTASTWEDWNLSAYIPAGAKYAAVFIRSNSSTAYYGMVRKKGDTSITNTVYLRYYAIVNMLVELDANRVCQRYATNTSLKFGVVGYTT
ncbi:MAG: hypothetical protein ACUVX1_12850 [Chloroflexota bacterium]